MNSNSMFYLNAEFSRFNILGDVLGVLSVNSDSDGEASSENFFDSAFNFSGKGFLLHQSSDSFDLLEAEVSSVFVGGSLDLPSLSDGLFKLLDDIGGAGGE